MPQNTVFVVGAGASKEAKLPTGDELKKEISERLNMQGEGFHLESGDPIILNALRLHVLQPDGSSSDIDPYIQECLNICGALPLAISIDNYIDQHRDNKKIELCAKLAIVQSILDAERNSLLHFEKQRLDSNINFHGLSGTWYLSFFKLLTDNCTKNELKVRFESIILIIFNYDRCVEHFLYCALQRHYGLNEIEAAKLVKNINIYHPYGSVGLLPWINTNGAVNFGLKPKPKQLLEISQQIKTFTEVTDPKLSEIIEIRKHMSEAQRLVFLGFAFHKLNMELIAPEYENARGVTGNVCFATTKGISKDDQDVVKKQIAKLYHSRENRYKDVLIKINNTECGPFFSEFWRSLAF
jgi:hypothetical protein